MDECVQEPGKFTLNPLSQNLSIFVRMDSPKFRPHRELSRGRFCTNFDHALLN